jgi:hypothetical protein
LNQCGATFPAQGHGRRFDQFAFLDGVGRKLIRFYRMEGKQILDLPGREQFKDLRLIVSTEAGSDYGSNEQTGNFGLEGFVGLLAHVRRRESMRCWLLPVQRNG